MNEESKTWQENNQQYLKLALEWLRLRLQRLAQISSPAGALPEPAPLVEPPRGLPAEPKWKLWNRVVAPEPSQKLLPPGPDSLLVTEEQLARASEKMTAAESVTPPPAMIMLAQSFGMSRFERNVLLLCVAMELDTRIPALCARAQDNPNSPYPTFALAMALFDEAEWNAISPEGSLRHWRLIEISQPAAQPLTASALRADERIVNFLKGLNYLDDRLAPLLLPLPAQLDTVLPPSHQRVAHAIVDRMRQTDGTRAVPVIQLAGADTASKQLVAQHAAAALGLRLYRLPAELMPTHAGDLETLARLSERETALWPMAIYLDAVKQEREGASETHAPPLNRFLTRSNGVIFLDARDSRQLSSRETITIDIAKPTPAEQETAWVDVLGAEVQETAATLATQFNLNLLTIHQVADSTREPEGSDPALRRDRLWSACLEAVRPELDGLAQRIEPKATWDDLALSEVELKLLGQIAAQVRHRGQVYGAGGFAATRSRGLSINALFAGESGTGKTMSAEVLANDLRLNLYRIDLSAVVNKYIGETEKNLRRLFDAAEDGGVILFFDEADALFGKRSEVKDSHDRYANIEINYLLQRLESFSGLAIMATNMQSALDPAFMRRIRFIVNFRQQGQPERKAIWERIFPEGTETRGLDYVRLSRLNLNGGSINNVAINAAFLAAAAGTPVTMTLLLDAARTEFLKLKRTISEADFAWVQPAEAVA
ncbi:MAG TPA: ATP-binding protein [Blastocatellia bacterium]|nr:ATP-binding protein [Blastocatellia bacterium]